MGITGPKAIRCRARRRWKAKPPTAPSRIADVLGVPIYMVHVSCIEGAAEAIARARAAGQRVYGEVLAGHLVVDDSSTATPTSPSPPPM
jgi:dihydropyrimidinase